MHELVQDHFNPDDISLLVTDQRGTHEEGVEHDTGIAEGAVGTAAVGGILGALGATLVATGIIVAPGIAVWATGPLVAALKGALAGSAAGSGFGSLAGLGFWEDEAHIHADGLKRGGVVVAVPAIQQLELPADSWAGRVTAPVSVEAACQAAIGGERANAALYATLLAAAEDYPDVERTFRRLLTASQENHLPAFERGLQREQGGGAGQGGGCGDGPRRRRRRRGGNGVRTAIEER